MKALILIAAFAFPASAPAGTAKENCAALANLAHTIMQAHQGGTPFANIASIIDQQFPDPTLNDAMMAIALQAYAAPRYTTEGAKERAAADFRDRIHVWCLA